MLIMLCNKFDMAEIKTLWFHVLRYEIHVSGVNLANFVWIAEMLFMLLFAHITV